MLQDVPMMTRQELYDARFEVAGLITQARGLVLELSKDKETRPRSIALRRELDAAEALLLSVLRPR